MGKTVDAVVYVELLPAAREVFLSSRQTWRPAMGIFRTHGKVKTDDQRTDTLQNFRLVRNFKHVTAYCVRDRSNNVA